MGYRPQAMDSYLEENLFPANLPVDHRARHWVSIFLHLDDTAQKVFSAILGMKHRLRTDTATYLELRQKRKDADSPELHSKLKVVTHNMAAVFPDSPKTEDDLARFHLLKDNNIFNCLPTLTDLSTTFAQARAAREEVLKRLGEKHPQYSLMKTLTTKLSLTLLGGDHVSAIFALLLTPPLPDDPHLVGSALRVIAAVAHHFPGVLEGHLPALLGLVKDGSQVGKDGALRVISLATSLMEWEESDIGDILTKCALEGSRKEAKHAVAAIASMANASQTLPSLYQVYTPLPSYPHTLISTSMITQNGPPSCVHHTTQYHSTTDGVCCVT